MSYTINKIDIKRIGEDVSVVEVAILLTVKDKQFKMVITKQSSRSLYTVLYNSNNRIVDISSPLYKEIYDLSGHLISLIKNVL